MAVEQITSVNGETEYVDTTESEYEQPQPSDVNEPLCIGIDAEEVSYTHTMYDMWEEVITCEIASFFDTSTVNVKEIELETNSERERVVGSFFAGEVWIDGVPLEFTAGYFSGRTGVLPEESGLDDDNGLPESPSWKEVGEWWNNDWGTWELEENATLVISDDGMPDSKKRELQEKHRSRVRVSYDSSDETVVLDGGGGDAVEFTPPLVIENDYLHTTKHSHRWRGPVKNFIRHAVQGVVEPNFHDMSVIDLCDGGDHIIGTVVGDDIDLNVKLVSKNMYEGRSNIKSVDDNEWDVLTKFEHEPEDHCRIDACTNDKLSDSKLCGYHRDVPPERWSEDSDSVDDSTDEQSFSERMNDLADDLDDQARERQEERVKQYLRDNRETFKAEITFVGILDSSGQIPQMVYVKLDIPTHGSERFEFHTPDGDGRGQRLYEILSYLGADLRHMDMIEGMYLPVTHEDDEWTVQLPSDTDTSQGGWSLPSSMWGWTELPSISQQSTDAMFMVVCSLGWMPTAVWASIHPSRDWITLTLFVGWIVMGLITAVILDAITG